MKKLLLIAPLLLGATAVDATVIAYDHFTTTGTDAYADDRLWGQSPTAGVTGFSGSTAWGGNFNTGDIEIDATGLSASLAVGPTGGSVITDGADGDRNVYRAFDSFTTATQTYYFSFLFNVGTGGTAGARSSLGITAGTAPNGPDPIDGVMVGVDLTGSTSTGTINLWVDGIEIAFSGSGITAGNTYFALVQIDNQMVGNDTITANFYSATATDFTSSLGTASTSAYDISSDLKALEIQKDSAGNFTSFDEFYFGTEISDVSIVPEPTGIALLLLGAFPLVVRRRR